jgi:adenylate cyclase
MELGCTLPRLLIFGRGEDSRVLELSGDRPISIGRAKSNEIVLDDPCVSRLHAIVRAGLDGKWEIIDRDSSNQMKINGAATKEAVLKANDEISIGECRLRFEDSAARKVTAYGSAELPRGITRALSQSSYSSHLSSPSAYSGYAGSSLSIESVAGVAASGAPLILATRERANARQREQALLALLDRVNRSLGEIATIEEVTQKVLSLVLEIEGAERAYAMLLEEACIGGDFKKGDYRFQPAAIRYRRPLTEQSKRAPELVISQSIIRQVMQAGLPRLVADATVDPRLASSQSIVREGIMSAMCAPLGIGNRLRGLLYVDNLSQRGMFTVDDLNVFSVIAVQAGLAIDRVRSEATKVL